MDHKQRSRFGWLAVTLIAACSLIASSAIAEMTAAKPDVKEIMGLDGISWESSTIYKSARLVVSGPDGFRMEQDFAAGDTLFLEFASVAQKSGAPNGQFKYELVFTPFMTAEDKALADEARSLGVEASSLGAVSIAPVSGVFTLEGGNIVDVDLPETTLKDIVHLDDVIIDGSLCVGFDCVNGESFGFETIRLKENNLRIRAFDTSTSASFPTRDWQIVFNETSNGGQEKFSIEDIDGGRTPFTIEAGAPSHSLYVDDGGRIGLGTSTPVVEVHIVDGDTPTLRLEQDGSSGFTPQTWDVAGNETNFFVRDVTNGSQLPFRIRPDAPSNSIFVDTDGDVGMGTSSPAAPLHVRRTSGNTNPIFENTASGAVQFRLQSDSENRRIVARDGGGGTQASIVLQDSGRFQFLGTDTSDPVCVDFTDTDGAGTTRCSFLNGAINCTIGACP